MNYLPANSQPCWAAYEMTPERCNLPLKSGNSPRMTWKRHVFPDPTGPTTAVRVPGKNYRTVNIKCYKESVHIITTFYPTFC